MARTIRFHLDENVGYAIATGLRRLGVDVTTTPDVDLCEATDPEQLAFATAQGRVFFTQDEDFLSLASEVLEHPGIVHCRPNTRSIGAIISGLELIWEVCESGEMPNQVFYI